MMQIPTPTPTSFGDILIDLPSVAPAFLTVAAAVITTAIGVVLWFRRELKAEIRDLWTNGVDPLRADAVLMRERTATLTARLDADKDVVRRHSPELVMPGSSHDARQLVHRWGTLDDIIDMHSADLAALSLICEEILASEGHSLAEKASALQVLRQVRDEIIVRENRGDEA